MKEWLTAAELADEALPGFPHSTKGVLLHADRKGWSESLAYARPRDGRGGGLEFHVSLLPTAARLAYEARYRRVETIEPAVAAGVATRGSDRPAKERDARLAILAAFESFQRGTGFRKAAAAKIFADRYNARTTAVDDWILDAVGSISPRTLARWTAERDAGRADRLAVKRDHRRGKGLLDLAENGRVRTFVLALLASQPHLSGPQIRRQIRAEFGDTLAVFRGGARVHEPVPPVRTIQHFAAGLRETERVALLQQSNPDRYRSTAVPAGTGSYRDVTVPNTLWMIDASPVDALCTDGRWSIYACVDIATRSLVLYVSRTPRSASVQLLARKAILTLGRPETIKHDNGADFVAEDSRRLFAALGIEIVLSPPYQPQTKAHVERAIRTFQHDCAAQMAGYTGHSVGERKAIEDRKSFADRLGADTAETFAVSLTGADLQQLADAWVRTTYDHAPHRGLDGRTPFQARAASPRPIVTVDERALDLLLMPVAGAGGVRTVTKLGVRIDHFHYGIAGALPGDRVMVRMDPHDAGRAFAFDAETGRFVGEALCAELAGVDPQALVAERKAAQAEVIADRMKGVKEEIRRLTRGPSLLERALSVAERDLAASSVVAFPKREVAHTTPAIEAAIAAMEARSAPSAAPTDPRVAAEQARIEAILGGRDEATVIAEAEARFAARQREVLAARAEGLPANAVRLPETPMERYRRALAIQADPDAAHPDDLRWLGGYELSAEFRGLQRTHEAFGDAFLSP